MKTKTEFGTVCGDCGGPLVQVDTAKLWPHLRGPRLPVWVHARNRQYVSRPHAAQPVDLHPTALRH